MSRGIIVGSRGSRLALVQAESVVARIREANPCLEISLREVATTGDRDHRTQLGRMGPSVFVKELEEALLDNRIDMAVHSLKDVPTDIPQGLCLLAVTERLDPRDVLVSRKGRLDELPPGSRIGTDSLRRAVQLRSYRPDLEIRGIRGNVDTRLRKVAHGEFDGVILAAAAMLRLGWQERITEYLPLETFLPAAGQGALVIEARLGDEGIAGLVSPINNLPAWQCVTAERAFLRTLGGGCRAPVAALGMVNGNKLRLEGMVAGMASLKMLRASEEGTAVSAEEIGVRLAHKMTGMGASEFIAEGRAK
jgi:hydroxymethylbilane synthase